MNKVLKEGVFVWSYIVLITLIIYAIVFGVFTLNPKNISWLLSVYHDWGQHYLGWAFYRQDEWRFPLGEMKNFYYPVGTNVGFTDSIPLLAFLFKIFDSFLPDNFQYFGLWLYSCLVLNAYFTYKILKLYKIHIVTILIAIILIDINPTLIFRGMHPALCAHWLIIGSIYYYLKANKDNGIQILKRQSLLFLVSCSINPYLAVIVACFTLILPFKQYFYDKSINIRTAILLPLLTLFSGLIFWFIFGMVEIGSETTALDVGNIYGLYSLNLNSFFNSYGHYSKFIPHLGMVTDSQHEGFAYLGLGLLFLIIIAFIIVVVNFKKIKIAFLLPLILLLIGFTLFAISNQVSYGSKVLFEYPTLAIFKKLGNIFRAIGRFVWPLYYFLIIGSIIIIAKINALKYFKIFLFSTLLLLQIYDTENLITARQLKSGEYHTKLKEKEWNEAIHEFSEVITYPPYTNNLVYSMDYQDLMFIALKNKKPISNGYVARENVLKSQSYKDSIKHSLELGMIPKNRFYVTNKFNLKDFNVLIYKNEVNFRMLDDFYLLFSKESDFGKYYKQNEREQFVADSIKKTFNSIPQLFSLNKQWKSEQEIKFNVEKFLFLNDVIQISGWAFQKSQNNNKNDSIFISLKGENNYFLYPVESIQRGDISTVNSGKFLDNSGFSTTIFIDKLPKRNYDVGIVIIDNSGFYHYANLDKICEKGKKIYQDVTIIENLPNQSENILGNLEKVEKNKQDVYFSGWAIIKDIDSEEYSISIVLVNDKDKKHQFSIETNSILRNDVTISFENKKNYDKSGYTAKIKSNSIKSGTYTLGVLIKTPQQTELKMYDKKIKL